MSGYLGGKVRIVDEILPYILKGRTEGVYVEPFVGSGSVIVKVPPTFRRIGNDKNPYVLALLEAIRDGYEPPDDVTEEMFDEVIADPKKFPKHYVGFVGLCTFGCQFFNTFNRSRVAGQDSRYFTAQQKKHFMIKKGGFQGVEFKAGSFAQLEIPEGAIVYCDPPYEGTVGYGYRINNFTEFWKWADKLAEKGHEVYVSGYKNTPRGTILTADKWKIIWEKEISCTVARNPDGDAKDRSGRVLKTLGGKRVECLVTRKL